MSSNAKASWTVVLPGLIGTTGGAFKMLPTRWLPPQVSDLYLWVWPKHQARWTLPRWLPWAATVGNHCLGEPIPHSSQDELLCAHLSAFLLSGMSAAYVCWFFWASGLWIIWLWVSDSTSDFPVCWVSYHCPYKLRLPKGCCYYLLCWSLCSCLSLPFSSVSSLQCPFWKKHSQSTRFSGKSSVPASTKKNTVFLKCQRGAGQVLQV